MMILREYIHNDSMPSLLQQLEQLQLLIDHPTLHDGAFHPHDVQPASDIADVRV